jgi:beta-fructofuranosidase
MFFQPTNNFSGLVIVYSMINNKIIIFVFSFNLISWTVQGQAPKDDATLAAYFSMELSANTIQEVKSGKSFVVQNNFQRPENVTGIDGQALRLDGFSTFCKAEINTSTLNTGAMTFSLWCAMETYPVMDPNNEVNTRTYIAGNLDDQLKSGFAFTMNATGNYAFEVYVDGAKIICSDLNVSFPLYKWNHLIATVDSNSKEINLYCNGQLISNAYFFGKGIINSGNNSFIIGKSFEQLYSGIFRTNTINGLIDEIRIYNTVLPASERSYTVALEPDLSIPESRHENDIQRPAFHGLPATNWTNEPHGLVYYNNKYHLFFQKNANGPYWGKIHWGHLTSDNLLTWKEEKIALSNYSSYDIKGVWSGCVYQDDVLTGGKPNIFYTGVDYVKASINQAEPIDDNLISWTKETNNPVIPNRPAGLSDDFRDPYIFKLGNDFYMIVGTSKDGKGAATLHKYDIVNKIWSNDGKMFYQSSSINYGTFWEMPAIVQMDQTRWMFLTTILGGSNGVETLYWVGFINPDGTFNPYDSVPKEVELGNMSTNGYGLLSPSILQKKGKTIAIGIVPDKLPAANNLALGWAHLYSFPREWKLDSNNELVQTPYTGLENIRELSSNYAIFNLDLNSAYQLLPIKGKTLELNGTFIIGNATKFGFNVRKSGNNYVSVFYSPAENKIVVDGRNSIRIVNDEGVYNGLYESVLPDKLNVGDELNLHIIMDHSIMDIFLNNKYAFSIRIFPTETTAEGVELFSEGGNTRLTTLQSWQLNPLLTTLNDVKSNQNNIKLYSTRDEIIYNDVPADSLLNIYNITGSLVFSKKIKNESGKIYLPKNQVYLVNITGKENFSRKIVL